MVDNTEIVVGTYEEFLVGYKVKNTNDTIELIHSFATHAHTGSIKCVAAANRYLASGGSDDKIIVHDMKLRTENKVLLHHSGTVNTVAFSEDGSHILSGGSDGSLYALRTGSWQIEKHWSKAHKGSAITHIAIHPSNKLALTIGDDHTLRTWNLIKGRQAYTTNLKSKGTANPISVVWSPDGNQFSLTGYNDITIWSIDNAAVEKILKCDSKAICMVWISENLAVAGLENGQVILFDLESGNKYNFQAHNQRVKGIAYEKKYLYTASSFGDVKIWKFKESKMKFVEKACINTDCRITCLTLVDALQHIKTEDDEIPNAETILNPDRLTDNEDESVADMETDKIVKKSINKKLLPYVTITTEKEPKKPKIKKPIVKAKANEQEIKGKVSKKSNKKWKSKQKQEKKRLAKEAVRQV